MSSDYYAKGHTHYTLAQMAAVDSRIQNVVDAVTKHTPSGGNVLDLGCGDAYLRTRLEGLVYAGMDIDVSKLPTDYGVREGDLSKEPYPFEDSSQDTIICSEVLEHLWEPEVVLRQAGRMLRPKGRFIVTVPNFECIDSVLTGHPECVYDRRETHTVEHIRQYTSLRLAEILWDHRFRVLQNLGNSPQMSGFFSNARKVLHEVLGKTQIEADQVLGRMFPNRLPGILLIAEKL
jgi:SAM-dependent methyltransferase